MGPYRTQVVAAVPSARSPRWGWLTRWLWCWRHRRCLRGEHHPELCMVDYFTLRTHLRCRRCGAQRPVEGYGPVAYRAIGEWSLEWLP